MSDDMLRRLKDLESAVHGVEATVQSLERWRDSVDAERGLMMHELGKLAGTQQHLVSESTKMDQKLDSILAALEERPSRVELNDMRRGLDSIRAKARPIQRLSNLHITFGKASVRLGASGVTFVAALALLVMGVTLWALGRLSP